MAGYSGTPLAKKLGIRAGARCALIGAPRGFRGELEPLPDGVRLATSIRAPLDVALYFAPDAAGLRKHLGALKQALDSAGGLWVAWPKKSSGVATDLSFDVVQQAGLALGLVDNKVCAVNETWSGLRFVYRREDRPRAAPAKKKTGARKQVRKKSR